ncbi:MAG: hypothetical protein ACYC46_07780 [Acidobacteriaceae bacterium]
MKVTIDNLDGKGPADYSAALSTSKPLRIERKLNEPTICTMLLDCNGASLEVPVRRARITITAENSALLFTGYVATEPAPVYAGAGMTGPLYLTSLSAMSDEWLLDKQPVPMSGAGYSQGTGQLLKTLTSRVGTNQIATNNVVDTATVGLFVPEAAYSWSRNAGALANMAYAAYRVVSEDLTLQPVGSVTHALNDTDGTLNVAGLKTGSVKELANDVTLTGELEPTAYVTELFLGDGATTLFDLTREPISISAAKSKLINESFDEPGFNTQVWSISDPGSHFALSSTGLQLNGGNGYDGQTTLTAIDMMEMGGALVLEVGNVQLNAGSDGVLCGLYRGIVGIPNCFAGYRVRQSNGNTIVVPLVNGVETGTQFTIVAGHSYTLRVRVYCVELQRVMQTYYAMSNGAIQQFGGDLVSAPMSLVFDLQDLGSASSTPATVLYDGSVDSSSATCSFCPVNSIDLLGSVGFLRATQTGTAWVVSTLPTGTKYTRLIGLAGEGTDCKVERTGKISFYAGRVPVANELIAVSYRIPGRAVARLADTASITQEAASGLPGTARWLGKVEQPPTRSSADCENAAAAVLCFSTNPTAAWNGTYAAANLQQGEDVWPGDLLAIQSAGQQQALDVVVRSVQIEASGSSPEMLQYKIGFANDWAEGLSMKLSTAISTDVFLPQQAESAPGNVLDNLQQMQVLAITTSALQVDAGVAPPTNGGFEVRRRDWDFGAGVDQDLVLRSPVRSFSIPRAAQQEQYFIRMYDGSTPPVYSRFSSVVFTNVPV